MKSLTKKQFDAIRNGWSLDPNIKDGVGWKYEEIDESFVKHDITSYQFIFQDPSTGKWYSGWYSRSYNWGIDDSNFPIELQEVEKVEVTTFEWRPVNNE